jgi:hypothetical protein
MLTNHQRFRHTPFMSKRQPQRRDGPNWPMADEHNVTKRPLSHAKDSDGGLCGWTWPQIPSERDFRRVMLALSAPYGWCLSKWRAVIGQLGVFTPFAQASCRNIVIIQRQH